MRLVPILLAAGFVACRRDAPLPLDAPVPIASAAPSAPSAAAIPAPSPHEAPLDVAIGDLLSEYKVNELRADGRWKGKLIRAHGVVTQVSKDIAGGAFVVIGSSSSPEIPALQCFLADPAQPEAVALSAGTKATVQGRVSRLLGNVMVRDCVVNPMVRMCNAIIDASPHDMLARCSINPDGGDAMGVVWKGKDKNSGPIATIACVGEGAQSSDVAYDFITGQLAAKGETIVGSRRARCFAQLQGIENGKRVPFPEPLRVRVAAFFEAL